MEIETSARMASELRELGFEVTTGVGGNGVAGVLRNGSGPVLMLRTDMDALPIAEETGLEFASRKMMKSEQGENLPVMHACGHDIHMTVWLGTLKTLVNLRNSWKGTILAVAQPAEETGKGARAMIEDGLFKRFPVPDMALCYHVSASLPAGVIGYIPGPAYAGSTSAGITIFGIGGHGATPHKTIDPVVIAAETIMGIQTIVSRTINPLEPAVITVGSVHGGTKNNIIPDKVNLQLTIRYYSEEVHQQILKSLVTLTNGIALSSGLPADKMPAIVFGENQTPPLYNDPDLVARTVAAMQTILEKENLLQLSPTTVSEDFARYGKTEEKIPVSIFWLGTVSREAYEKSTREGKMLPMLHNAGYYPDFSLSYQTGVAAMAKSCIELFNSQQP
jgi:hippurate hydrolase